MIDTIGMTDIGNGRPSNQDAYLLRQQEKNGKLYLLAVSPMTMLNELGERRDRKPLYCRSIETVV